MRKQIIIAAALCLCAMAAGAATLDVNAGAALEGNYGMEVIFNGATSGAYVVDTTPNNETTYTAEFKIEVPAGFDFSSSLPAATPAERQAAHHLMFLVMDLDQPGGAARQHVSVHIKKFDIGGGVYRFRLWSRLYAPTNPWAAADGYIYRTSTGEAMEVNLPTSAAGYPVTVRLEWQAESSVGAADGVWSLTRDNAFAPGTFDGKTDTAVTGNSDKNVDQVAMGAVSGVDTGTTGSMYFDSFVSTR